MHKQREVLLLCQTFDCHTDAKIANKKNKDYNCIDLCSKDRIN